MKSILTITLILLSAVFLQAQNTIEVSVSGFENDNGKAMVGLYNTKTDFLRKVYKSFAVRIVGGKTHVTFEDIPDGTYAISVYHDENENKKFDRLFGMIPQENYGNSNNVPPRFGPPKWVDAMFDVRDKGIIEIEVQMM